MPKLREKPLRKPEDIAAVPTDQPVLIDTGPEPEPVVQAEPERDAAAVDPQQQQQEPAVEQQTEPEPEQDDNSLQKQVEAAQRAEALAREQLADLQRRMAEQQRQLQERDVEVVRYRGDAEQAQYDAIVNAINAATAEAETAQRDLETADLNQDAKAKAEAYRRLARAESNIAQLESGKAVYEQKREERKTEAAVQRQQPAPQQQDAFEAAIASIPSEPAKDWLRKHPDYITDVRKNAKIKAAHFDVIEEGHAQFTPAYFESLETHLGLRQKADTQRRQPVMSAPPTRDVPGASNGYQRPSQVTLTPEQREAARIAGIDEVTYARNVIKLNEMKKAGHYGERG